MSRALESSPWLAALVLLACSPTDDPIPTTDTDATQTTVGSTGTATDAASSASTDATSSTSDASTSSTGADDSSTSDASTSSTGADPVCGDGAVEGDEDCDDAGESATCDDDCTLATCGDGVVNITAAEQCDEGGESATCDVDCTAATCGDGVFNAAAGELCDEGGATALCDADCTLGECGDGVINAAAGEACDDAGESAGCNLDCSLVTCGDGITNLAAGEACDDAGESAGCNLDCSLATCGDGLTNATAGEACDGTELGGATCQTQGFLVGTLACSPGCTYDTGSCANPPAAPVLTLGFSAIKRFDFSWVAVPGADDYPLEERAAPGDPFVQLGSDIVGTSISHVMPLHLRRSASYQLRACNVAGCSASAGVDVMSSMTQAVGYFKASNTAASDYFGTSVTLSGDGTTLVVGADSEDSSAIGVNGDQASNAAASSGAVYVYVRDVAGAWTQQAYLKASNTGAGDAFGHYVAISNDGNTLAVGAHAEDSSAAGVGGNQASNAAADSGAAYVFVRDGAGAWSHQAYVKASNTTDDDRFGSSLALSAEGDVLAVGAAFESSSATGIDGNQANNGAGQSGAVYLLERDAMGVWSHQTYVKASNTGATDYFGRTVALSDDGDTLAVGAYFEDSSATGINGDQANNTAASAGAAYVFARDGLGLWSQQAYVKASNTGASDYFGVELALSGDGNVLAVGAMNEDGGTSGVGGNQADESVSGSGATYVFVRDGAGAWSQRSYVKASNPGSTDGFGIHVALSADAASLAVASWFEGSSATGIGGDQANNNATFSGAVYLY